MSNIAFFLYWTLKMLNEINLMLIKKFSKVYIFLVLCGDKKRYKLVLDSVLVKEENDILRERFMIAVSKVRDLYNSGRLVLNQRLLERVEYYIMPEKVLAAAGLSDENGSPPKSLIRDRAKFKQ